MPDQVSRLVQEKLPAVFVEMAALVHAIRPHSRFVLVSLWPILPRHLPRVSADFSLQVGDGPQRELLEHLVILNGLQNVFFFRGHRENVHAELQVSPILIFIFSTNESAQGFDLFAYPTSGESVGWVILEAMAAGKAIVSTAVGSVPTLITHAFNGFLTQSTEAIELVEYVVTLMDADDLRNTMGMRSRERAIREFSWDGFIQAYHSMFARRAHAADRSCAGSDYCVRYQRVGSTRFVRSGSFWGSFSNVSFANAFSNSADRING